MEKSEQEIKEWTEENAPLGKQYGYPNCCIKEFCEQPPSSFKGKPTDSDFARYDAGCVNGKFTGFIPCLNHAKQINNGEITLNSLIVNRDKELNPFPFEGYYEDDSLFTQSERLKAISNTIYLLGGSVLVGILISKIFKTNLITPICFSFAATTIGIGYYEIQNIKKTNISSIL